MFFLTDKEETLSIDFFLRQLIGTKVVPHVKNFPES